MSGEFRSTLQVARNLHRAIDADKDGYVTYSQDESTAPRAPIDTTKSSAYSTQIDENGRVTYAPLALNFPMTENATADNSDKMQKSELKKFCEKAMAGKEYLEAAAFKVLANQAGFSSLGIDYFDKNITDTTDKAVYDKVVAVVDEMFAKTNSKDTIEGYKISENLPQGMNGSVVKTFVVDRTNHNKIVETYVYSKKQIIDMLFETNRDMYSGDGKVTQDELFDGLSKFMASVDSQITDGRTSSYNQMMADINASEYDKGPDLRTEEEKEAEVQSVINELNGTPAKKID